MVFRVRSATFTCRVAGDRKPVPFLVTPADETAAQFSHSASPATVVLNWQVVDTSALYALIDRNDRVHRQAVKAFDGIPRGTSQLVSSSHVLLETVSLVQARLGLTAVREWRDEFQPLLDVVWVDADLHTRAMVALVAAGRRKVSLTDWTSFEIMRTRHITRAFAFDPHFAVQGFQLLA